MSENKSQYTEVNLPLIPLRGVVAFPGVQLNIEIVRPTSLKAFTAAATLHDMDVLLVTQKDVSVEAPTEEDLPKIGVLAKIRHVVKNTQNNLSVVFEGIARVKIESIESSAGFMTATAEVKHEISHRSCPPSLEALIHEIKNAISDLAGIHPSFTEEMRLGAEAITDPGKFADFVASSALIDYSNKQSVLELMSPKLRLEKLLIVLEEEKMLLQCERDIQIQVREKIDRSQKDYFLREQVKAIQAELGEDEDDEIREYEERILSKKLPDEVREKLMKELAKLSKTPFGAAESTVLRSYLDTCLEFPFNEKSEDSISVAEARDILNADHDGLEKVKERILEFVAVRQFSKDVKNQTICLVGPPGVGKTSVASSIAKALGRKYARVSLGGMHDEAEIRGHRKTYVGAMPGRIVSAITNAKVSNPVIVLDEIDKLDRKSVV